MAHFAKMLCDDLLEPQKMRERGNWARAAEAVAHQAEELGAGRDASPLCLAAAICIFAGGRCRPPCLEGSCPNCVPGPSEGPGRSHAPRSGA